MSRMKRIVDNLEVTVFAHATENENKVLKCLQVVLPENIGVEKNLLRGHYGNPITKFFGKCRGKKAQSCLDDLIRKMSREDLKSLIENLKNKFDSSCHLYLRLSKQEAYEGKVKLSEGDDVIHVKVKVLARPAKVENATRIIRNYLLGVSGCVEKEEDT